MSNQWRSSSSQRCNIGMHAQSKSLGPLVPWLIESRSPSCSCDPAQLPLPALTPAYRKPEGIPRGFQAGAKVQVTAIHAISHHPGNRDLSLPEALDHLHRQFRFGLEAHRCRDARLLTPLRIFCPNEGKIEFAGNEGMPTGRDVGEI